MKYKEEQIFRNQLGALLDKANVDRGPDRDCFINLSWKKYSSKNKKDKLIGNDIESDMTLEIRKKLNKEKLWKEYHKFMNDGEVIQNLKL